jgi:amino acid adenylation domain-containing protein
MKKIFCSLIFKYERSGEMKDLTIERASSDLINLAANQRKKEEEYWLHTFSGQIKKSRLPYDFNVPCESGHDKSSVPIKLSPETLSKLMKITGNSDNRLYVVLAATLLVLIAKYSNNTDITFGMPIYRQKDAGAKLINQVIAIRENLQPTLTFKQLISKVGAAIFEAIKHQNYPIERLVEKLDIQDPGDGGFPLFDIALVLKSIQDEHNLRHTTTNVLLTFSPTPTGLTGELKYNPSLYRRSTADRIASHFAQSMQEALFHIDAPVAELDMISPEEKQLILNNFNDTGREYSSHKTIYELFEEQAQHTPGNIALKGVSLANLEIQDPEPVTLTYRELKEQTNRLAGQLRAKGVKPGITAGIMVERSFEMIVGILAVLNAGGAYLPIDTDYPAERIHFILQDSLTGILLTTGALIQNIDKKIIDNKEIVYLEQLNQLEPINIDPRPASCSSADIAYVTYTSGSTGKPKGVVIENRSMVNLMEGLNAVVPYTEEDSVLSLTTICFDVFGSETLLPLTRGSKVVVGGRKEQFEPLAAARMMENENITIFQSTPSRLQLFTMDEDAARALPLLKFLMVAGEAFPPPLLEKTKKLVGEHTKIYNIYGPTEATVYATIKDVSGNESLNIGTPILNTQVYILSPSGLMQPIGVTGEMCISGEGLARGYLNRPELTAQKFTPIPMLCPQVPSSADGHSNWDTIYRTGDLARWLPDGNIEYLGRIDHQVKIRGFRIELGEIETRLLTHPKVKEAVVLDRQSENGNKYLCAYIVTTNPDKEFDLDGLKEYLAASLPEYMVPSFFVSISQIPLTTNGKIDRASLPVPEITGGCDYVAPRNDVEIRLAEIWAGVLEIEKIGINDSFFRLGGDSIKAIQIHARMRKLDYPVEFKDIFSNLTIARLANQIIIRQEEIEKPSIPGDGQEKGAETQFTTGNYSYNGLSITEIDELTRDYNVEDIYPLAPMQEGMLFHSLKNTASNAYLQQVSYRFKGHLDPTLMEDSLNELFKRHDIFRTRFIHGRHKRPLQVLLKEQTIDFVYIDVREQTPDQQRQQLDNHKNDDRNKTFSLLDDVLMRVALFRLSQDEFEVQWTFHHILMDGWSLGIISAEFFEIYGRLSQGDNGLNKPFLTEVRPFKDYINWIETRDKETSRGYWRNYLEGYREKASLPRCNARSKENRFKNEEILLLLDNTTTQRLNELAARNHVTLNTVVQSMWGILLARYCSRDDVAFGAVVSGRPSHLQDVESMVGLFINTVPLRITFNAQTTFPDLLQIVQQGFINSEPYHYVSLAEIQAETSLKNELLDHIIGFENFPVTRIMGGISAKENNPFHLESLNFETVEQSNYDFSIVVVPGEQLYIKYRYNSYAYDEDLVMRLKEHMENLIHFVIESEHSSVPIAGLDVLSDREKQRLMYDFNDTHVDFPIHKTVARLFEEQVEKTPDSDALVFEEKTLSYSQLNQKADWLAAMLREKGVQPNTIVAMLMGRSPEMIVGMLGILKAGGGYLPIKPQYPVNRIKRMLKDSGTSLLLTRGADLKGKSFTLLQDLEHIHNPVCLSPSRATITDFDSLSIPDRSLVNYEAYNKHIGLMMVKNSMSMQASRGCPFNCAYCHKIWPKAHFMRSAEHIFAEVQLYYNMGVRRFSFVDDVFNLNVKNSKRFFQLIIENHLDVQLFFGLRGDILTKEYIDLMVQAGTTRMALALETASLRLQKLINKHLNIHKFRENLEYIAHKYPHVILELNTMHGLPTESEEEAQMTLDFIKNLKWLDFPYINILKIYPNTDMERLAEGYGISREAIEASAHLAYHELPETLPFDKSFTLKYQAAFLDEYFLDKERLLHVLPYQMKVLTEEELVRKYNSYLPVDIHHFDELLAFLEISRDQLGESEFVSEEAFYVPDLNKKLKTAFPPSTPAKNALRVLLLDLSQFFSNDTDMLYDLVEPPIGLMYLMTHLKKQLGTAVNGKIAKSRIDFNNYDQLKALLEEFKPDVIGIRSLTFYKNFFHRTVAMIRHWGLDIPVVAGGPYATGDYKSILQDKNVDLAVLGEGEITFSELIAGIIENGGTLPAESVLEHIPGLAFISEKTRASNSLAREIMMLDVFDFSATNKDYMPKDHHPASSNDLAYIIYTSGSTGLPKGVMIENRSVVNVVSWFARSYDVQPGTNVLSLTDYTFDASVNQVFGTLLHGGTLHGVSEDMLADIPRLHRYIREKQIHILNYVPTFFHELLSDQPRLPDVRAILSGGERLDDVIKAAIVEKGYDLYNQYGPTESTIDALVAKCNEDKVTLGRPIANVKVYILGKDGRFAPVWASGELHVGGAGLARGYLNRPELTEGKFVQFNDQTRLYRTGDLARWLPDGTVEFLGRIDNQVKIRGYRIELGEIESQLLAGGKVKDVVVLAKDTDNGGKYLCAYIIANQELSETPDPVELKEYLAQHLPDYMVPSTIVQLDKFPVTSGGKVDRKALQTIGAAVKDNSSDPANRTERKLATIWSEVLGIPLKEIGVHANFFELGGHSLKASLIASKINKQMDVKVPITEIFLKPTISQLAGCIKEAEKESFTTIRPVPKQDYYPLSSAQKRLFLMQQMDRNSISYNMPDAIYLDGSVEPNRLESVFHQLIQRHESLRTAFEIVDGEPAQVIQEHVPFDFQQYQADGEEDVIRLAGETFSRFVRPFDLTQSPLLRVGLVRNGKGKKLMLIDMHHIISDGISHEILREEFNKLYHGEELPKLRLQYKDYAHWQNSPEQQHKVKQQEAYWLNNLSGELPGLDLPTDFPRPVMQSFEGSSTRFMLEEAETSALKKIAGESGATLYMVILAIYTILLSKISAQEDIVVGTPIASRTHEDLQKIIGLFINTLAMRNFPSGSKTFEGFLAEVKKRTLDAFDNQDYQFENLVEQLDLPRDTSRNPIFDVMFNLIGHKESQHSPTTSENENNGKIENYKINSAKFDLNLRAVDLGDRVSLNLEFSTKLFTTKTIRRLIGYFKQIVHTVVADSDVTLTEIEIIPANAKEKKLLHFNEDLREPFEIKPIQVKMKKSFREYMHNTAIEYGHTRVSYGELEKKAATVYRWIHDVGAKKGQTVGIYLDNKVDFIASIIAILDAGCVFVPIDTTLPLKRVEQMIRCADIHIFLTDNKQKTILSGKLNKEKTAPTLLVIDAAFYETSEPLPDGEWEPAAKVQYNTDDRVYVYFTSGSTGTPNAIVGKNESLVQFILWEIDTFAVDETSRVSQLSAIGFDAFLRDIFVPLFSGGTVCIPGTQEVVLDQKKLAKWIDDSRIQLVHTVPSLFRHIFSNDLTNRNFTNLEFVLLSGEQINPNDIKRWYRTFGDRIQLVNFYGPTETTMIKSFHFIQQRDTRNPRIPAGVPMHGTRMLLLDKGLKVCDQGIAGEIYIRTPYCTYGYLDNPDLNKQRFIPNPFSEDQEDIIYRTGDLGRESANGEIEILGRIDRQVKVRGVRLDPGEIEYYLLKIDKVKDAVVIDRTDIEDGSYLCAYIVPYDTVSGEKVSPDASVIKKALEKDLPAHAIPLYVVALEKLPLSPNGKVDRSALPAPDKISGTEYVLPGNETEKQLVQIWSEVLKRPGESIGVKTNFFNLGGHSLKAAILADSIHKTMNTELLLTEIFGGPTVREMAELITVIRRRATGNEISKKEYKQREEVII